MTDAIQKAREAARKAYDEVSGNPTCDDPIGVAVDAALAALDAETDFKFHHAKDNIQDKENDHGSMGNAAFGICSGDRPNARGVDSVAVSRLAALDAGAEVNATPTEFNQIGMTLAFFASAIKSGENWTATCQREYDAAQACLTQLRSALVPPEARS